MPSIDTIIEIGDKVLVGYADSLATRRTLIDELVSGLVDATHAATMAKAKAAEEATKTEAAPAASLSFGENLSDRLRSVFKGHVDTMEPASSALDA